MFGTKDTGLMETLLRIRPHGAAKAPRIPKKVDDPMAQTPISVLVRKETYFPMSHSLWWSR